MEGKDKEDVRKIPMFGRIRSEFECLEKQQKNSNISKNSIIVQLLKSIRYEFQCLKGYDRNSNAWKNIMKIPMLGTMG